MRGFGELASLPVVFKIAESPSELYWTCHVMGVKPQYPYGEVCLGRGRHPRDALIDLLGKMKVV